MAVSVLGTLIIITGIMLVLFKKHETRLALSILLAVLGLSVLLISTVIIGMCQTASMPCRTGTEPGLIVLSAAVTAMAIYNIAALCVHQRVKDKD